MKKTKLLMPLTGVAALGAITPVVMTATSCNKGGSDPVAESTLQKIEASDTVTTRYIGTPIYKSEFKVIATYSDGTTETTKELGVDDWTCSDFNEEGFYTPGYELSHEFQISYTDEKQVSKTTSITAKLTIEAGVHFGLDNYYLNMGVLRDSGEELTYNVNTSKKLAIVGNRSGQIIDPGFFNFTSSDETKVTVDDEGIVTTVAAGTATITATWKDTTSVEGFDCEVTVNDDTAQATLFNYVEFDTTSKTADYEIRNDIGQGENNDIVTVPRSITLVSDEGAKTGTYEVTAINTRGILSSRAYNNIKTLIIPNTVVSFPTNTFEDGKLLNLYYNGTIEEFNAVEDVGSNWYGEQVIQAQCLDGTVALNDGLDTVAKDEVSTSTVGKYLTLENAIGSLLSADHQLVRFDFSKLTDLTSETVKQITIQFYKDTLFSRSFFEGVTVNAVYVDGAAATEDTDYTYEDGQIVFNFTSGSTVPDEESIVLVDITTPRGQFLNKIHMTAANLVE